MTKTNRSNPVPKTPPKLLYIAYTNIRGIRTNFSHVESFLSNSSPDIFALCETNLNSLVSNQPLTVSGYLPPIRKDSSTHMHGLGVYVRDNLPLARIPTLEDPNEPFMCFRLSLLHSTSYLFFLYRSPSSQSCSLCGWCCLQKYWWCTRVASQCWNSCLWWFQYPSSRLADTFQWSWLTRGWKVYNFSISQSLTQVVDFPTRFPDSGNHNPHLLNLFLTSNPTICKPVDLSPLGNSDMQIMQNSVQLPPQWLVQPPRPSSRYSVAICFWSTGRGLC